MEWLTAESIIALITLTSLEIVLGIDNIIFISILTGKLSTPEKQRRARRVGLIAAMGMRILLLFSLAWIIRLEEPLFSIFGRGISGRDLILIGGGLFLLAKATYEIHEKLEGEEGHASARASSFTGVILQIMALDIVFSLDSVITAVGMVRQIWVMVTAVVVAVIVMLLAVNTIADFVERHPTIKILALSFLLLIGFSLVAEGAGLHIPKGYIYFAMGFSVFVEILNIRVRQRGKASPVHLHSGYGDTQT